MKLRYHLLRNWIKGGLYCYYGRIYISGKENVPKHKPVLFLPNHQNALLDVLLVGVDCNRTPWFLTRSDVFKKPILKKLFNYLQMIPIYRIRDGRESLKNNEAVFKRCAELLENNEAILMFPEANHNLKRRVRPLSKGFTRILFGTLERSPELDIQLVPVGLNYKDAESFPDQVAIYFGKPIALREVYQSDDLKASTSKVKDAVANSLKSLTTHIEDEENYESISSQLEAFGVDYLKPAEVNKTIAAIASPKTTIAKRSKSYGLQSLLKPVFTLLNLPMVLVWRYGLKPKVWEPEFMGTFRYAFAILAYPIFYGLIFTTVTLFWTPLVGLVAMLGVFIFNWVYVRLK